MPLRQQAVLFRAAHHSDALEVELGRRNIPFVKYGGLRFLEAAHVKDALRLPALGREPARRAGRRSASRSCCPGWARGSPTRWCATWRARSFALPPALAALRRRPPAARADWPAFAELFRAAVRRRRRRGPAQHGPGAPLVRAAPRAPLRRRARAPRRSRAARAAGGGGAVARALPVRPDPGSAGRPPAPRPGRPTSTRTI